MLHGLVINWSGFCGMLHGLVINWSGFVIGFDLVCMIAYMVVHLLSCSVFIYHSIQFETNDARRSGKRDLRIGLLLYLVLVPPRASALAGCDNNNVRPIKVAINTKFLNCLQPEWSKYVTMVRQNQADKAISYDVLYDSLVQFEPHVLASKANKAAKNNDPLALIAHSNASLSHLHANSSYSPQSYYVTHPPSVVDYDDEYQGERQGDSQEDKLTTAMMLLA
ncbi:hypothetical protein Tco_1239505 [Tanacetum coccineum]